MRLGSSGLHIGRHVQIETPTKIRIGKNTRLNCAGHYVCGRNGYIHIGSDTHIGRHAAVSGNGGVTIGDRTAISASFVIFSSTQDAGAQFITRSPGIFSEVEIGSDVFIGASVTILPGVKIGNGAVIGAGSVVNSDIPARTIAVGCPAKVIREK